MNWTSTSNLFYINWLNYYVYGETIDSISVKRAYHVDDVLLSLRSGGKVIVTVDRRLLKA